MLELSKGLMFSLAPFEVRLHPTNTHGGSWARSGKLPSVTLVSDVRFCRDRRIVDWRGFSMGLVPLNRFWQEKKRDI